MDIQTTNDLFWLLLGISILLFTLFVCWGMFYFIMTLKDIRLITKNLKEKMKLLEDFIKVAKEKLNDTSLYLKTIVDTVVKVTGWVASKKIPADKSDDEKK